MSNLKKDLEDFKKTTEGFKKLKHPWAVKVLYPLFIIIIIIFIAITGNFENKKNDQKQLTQLEKSISHLPDGSIKVSSLSQTDYKNLCLNSITKDVNSYEDGSFVSLNLNMDQVNASNTAHRIINNGGSFVTRKVVWRDNKCIGSFSVLGILDGIERRAFMSGKVISFNIKKYKNMIYVGVLDMIDIN